MSHNVDFNDKLGIRQIKVTDNARVHIGNNYSTDGLSIEQRCHQAFSTSTYTAYKDDLSPRRIPGTCDWAFQHPTFLKWHQSTQNKVLWISADPGCGKSVIARSFVDESMEASDYVVCHFFFKDNVVQDKLGTALCAMLHQLFCQEPQLLRYAISSFRKHGKQIQHETNEMWTILSEASVEACKPVICVFDALDECCDIDRRHLIESLCKFQQSTEVETTSQPLKFLVTSRPYDNVTRWFSSVERKIPQIRLRGEDENEQINKEINIVLDIHVQELSAEFNLHDDIQHKLRESLRNMQNRTYLWLHLAIDSVRNRFRHSRRPNSVVIEHNFLPKDVDQAYDQLLNRVDAEMKETVRNVLSIIVGARRPLSSREMFMALSLIDSEDEALSAEDFDKDRFETQLRDWCGLFVYMNDSKLFLIHQTAKEFLVATASCNLTFESSWRFCLCTKKIEADLAELCISFLIHQTVETKLVKPTKDDQGRRKPPLETSDQELLEFFQYCSHHWFEHLEASKSVGTLASCRKVIGLCDRNRPNFLTLANIIWWKVRPHDLKRKQSKSFAPHLFSQIGYVTVLKCLALGRAEDWNTCDAAGRTPLIWAVENDDNDTISCLIELGVDIEAPTGNGYYRHRRDWTYFPMVGNDKLSALQIAYGTGRFATARLLVANGAKPFVLDKKLSGPDLWKSTWVKVFMRHKDVEVPITLAIWQADDLAKALYHAASYGNEEIVRMLLDHGADVNGTGGRMSPLEGAVNGSYPFIIEMLLKAGADVNTERIGYANALRSAVRSENKNAVIRLLEAGAAVNMPTESRISSPLYLALYANDFQIVTLLLEAGADVYARSGDELESALPIASREADVKIVELILRHIDLTIDSPAVTKLIDRAIMAAARKGKWEAVQLLLATERYEENAIGEALKLAAKGKHAKVVQKLYEEAPRAITPEHCRQALSTALTSSTPEVTAVIMSFTSHCNEHVAP